MPTSPLAHTLALFGLFLILVGCGGGGSPTPGAPRGSTPPVEETVELLLSARDFADQPLPVNGRGGATVGVGETFLLELSTIDHRPTGERLGAFQVFVDLLTDQANLLRPVIAETFRIIVGQEILTADPAGSVTFMMEGNGTGYTTTGGVFTTDPEAALTAALTQFGYVASDDYVLTVLPLVGQDIGLQIHWDVDRYGNVDMPDLSVALDFPESVPSQAIEFAPFEADGVTVNVAALRFSVDTQSRGFRGNEPLYTESVSASYSDATGFTGVGGVGPVVVGGIPQLNDNGTLPQPCDTFSLPVVVIAPVTGLRISASPSQAGGALYMYGLPDGVAEEDVRLDGDHTLTIDAVVR